MKHVRIVMLCTLVLAGAVIAAPLASAAYPGPNGKVAFIRLGDVHTAAPDGSGLKNVTRSGEAEEFPVVSPNGKLIAYTLDSNSRKRPFGVYTRTITGKKLKHLTAGAERADKYVSAHGPAWSPDGKRIAFACLLTGGTDVCTIDTKGKFKRLTKCACVLIQYPMDWSSASRIAFHTDDGIYTVGGKGGAPTPLVIDASAGDGSWKSDSSEYWYSCQTGDICAVGAGGGQGRKIWDAFSGEGTPGYLTGLDDPAWSPDGTRVLVKLRDQSGGRPDGLYVWDPATNDLRPVTTKPFTDTDPDWGPAPK